MEGRQSSEKMNAKGKKSTTRKTAASTATTTTGSTPKRKASASKTGTIKTSVAKTPAKKSATGAGKRKTRKIKKDTVAITPEQRHEMIALAAYVRAEQRGFTGGDEIVDWLSAEAEVDALLSR